MDNILVINLVSESSYQVSAVNLVIAVSLMTWLSDQAAVTGDITRCSAMA